ncbi:MAG: TIR domain-containing protein [Bacteroidia bacterium]|nr:TIR domain-containing protein [Bacteroidia bacterium]
MARVFISFDYDDIHCKKTVDNWKNQGLGTDISFTSEDGKSHSSKGESYVTNILREQIDLAQKVLVLVGNNTHNRPWVDYEVGYAKSKGKKVVWTQLPGTTGAPPKELRSTPAISFDLKTIQMVIRNG